MRRTENANVRPFEACWTREGEKSMTSDGFCRCYSTVDCYYEVVL